MNLFRRAEIHCVAIGEAPDGLLRGIADIGRGKFRRAGGDPPLPTRAASEVAVARPEEVRAPSADSGPRTGIRPRGSPRGRCMVPSREETTMTRSRGWLRAAVLSCFLLPSARAGADVPPPPDSPETKRVPVTIVDWGAFDRVTRKHVVASGDTLRSLAAKYLGDKEKWKVIADANPALAANPDRIKVGDALWIPPPRHAETPPPPTAPVSAETAPIGPWYDAFCRCCSTATARSGSRPARRQRTFPRRTAAGGPSSSSHAEAVPLLAAVGKAPGERAQAPSTTSCSHRCTATRWFTKTTRRSARSPR